VREVSLRNRWITEEEMEESATKESLIRVTGFTNIAFQGSQISKRISQNVNTSINAVSETQ